MNTLKVLKNGLYFVLGYLIFKLFKKNFYFSYHAMINLFCRTQGRFNELFAHLIEKFSSPIKNYDITNSIFYKVYGNDLDSPQNVVNNISNKGYHVLNVTLPEELIKKFEELSYSMPAQVRALDSQKESPGKFLFDLNNPIGVRYDFDGFALYKQDFIKDLVHDTFLTEIATQYLKVNPILELTEMWWHTKFQNTPDKNAAQFYHFDMDRLKWLKVFIYLTDVKSENGPHCFIEKSHKIDGIPKEILRVGYNRISDEVIESKYPKQQIKRFLGKRGTIIFEDTRGLHKGELVADGARLIFEAQYSINSFGSPEVKSQMAKL